MTLNTKIFQLASYIYILYLDSSYFSCNSQSICGGFLRMCKVDMLYHAKENLLKTNNQTNQTKPSSNKLHSLTLLT